MYGGYVWKDSKYVGVVAVGLLHRVVREGLSEVAFEKVLERHEGTSHEDMWVKSVSRRWAARTKPQR